MDEYRFSSIERLEHISKALGQIIRYCQGRSESDFLTDDLLSSGVLYQFLIIGEAIQYIDHDILKKHAYPWHLPRSFRNYIAHEYFGINLRQVFRTVTDLLPEFKVLVDKMIEDEKKEMKLKY